MTLTPWEMKFYSAQSKIDFINEHADAINDWVLNNYLDEFCAENGYVEWKANKKKQMRSALLEEL